MKLEVIAQILNHKSEDDFHTFKVYEDRKLVFEGLLEETINFFNVVIEDATDVLEPIESKANFTLPIPFYSL